VEHLSLMLLMATQHTLTVPVKSAPNEHAASTVGTRVIGPVAAGFACLTVGRPMLAAAQFKSVLEGDDLPSASLTSLHNNLALALLYLDRPDLAIEEYRKSIEEEPSAAAWVGVGNAAMALRDWDAAARAFAQALVLDPYDPRPYCGLGIGLARQRNVRQAISSHKQAIALEPSLGVPYALLGLAYELEANVQDAREAYRYCALHAGPNAGLNIAASERADQILQRPPTAVPTATLPPIPTPTPIPTSALYVVQRGDVLNVIAEEHGVSVEAIVELNNLSDPNAISIGQILLIPKQPE
jgi:tetratricopeptide (TPR) repeat protein